MYDADLADESCHDTRRVDLLEAQLAALFDVSRILSQSLQLRETLRALLQTLHERGRLCLGMVSLLDDESDRKSVV